MAKVKIFLDEGETLQEAEETLVKAMDHHNSGDVHNSHSFQDPAMVDVAERMESTFKKINQEMIEEISAALDGDYGNK